MVGVIWTLLPVAKSQAVTLSFDLEQALWKEGETLQLVPDVTTKTAEFGKNPIVGGEFRRVENPAGVKNSLAETYAVSGEYSEVNGVRLYSLTVQGEKRNTTKTVSNSDVSYVVTKQEDSPFAGAYGKGYFVSATVAPEQKFVYVYREDEGVWELSVAANRVSVLSVNVILPMNQNGVAETCIAALPEYEINGEFDRAETLAVENDSGKVQNVCIREVTAKVTAPFACEVTFEIPVLGSPDAL